MAVSFFVDVGVLELVDVKERALDVFTLSIHIWALARLSASPGPNHQPILSIIWYPSKYVRQWNIEHDVVPVALLMELDRVSIRLLPVSPLAQGPRYQPFNRRLLNTISFLVLVAWLDLHCFKLISCLRIKKRSQNIVICTCILLYICLSDVISSLKLLKCNRDIRAILLHSKAIIGTAHMICRQLKIVFAAIANTNPICKYYRLTILINFIEYVYEVLLNVDKFEQSGRAVPRQTHAFNIGQVVLGIQLHLRRLEYRGHVAHLHVVNVPLGCTCRL